MVGLQECGVEVLGRQSMVGVLLWIVAVVLVVAGVVTIVRGQLLWGVLLIVVGLAVGPGGWSVLR